MRFSLPNGKLQELQMRLSLPNAQCFPCDSRVTLRVSGANVETSSLELKCIRLNAAPGPGRPRGNRSSPKHHLQDLLRQRNFPALVPIVRLHPSAMDAYFGKSHPGAPGVGL